MVIKYKNIKREIRSLGLTQKKVASILGISTQTLDYRIAQNKPTIHWAIYGIANYYGGIEDNLIKEMNETT
jgi:transcriptional regulator with XRE-family HTH domain